MGVTESIARFIVETSFDQIPEKAVQATKGAILTDGLGVTLAGSLDPCGKAITEFVREQRCEGKAGVIGKGFRTSVPGAALANGAMLMLLTMMVF